MKKMILLLLFSALVAMLVARMLLSHPGAAATSSPEPVGRAPPALERPLESQQPSTGQADKPSKEDPMHQREKPWEQ
jgi:hypothetical protein